MPTLALLQWSLSCALIVGASAAPSTSGAGSQGGMLEPSAPSYQDVMGILKANKMEIERHLGLEDASAWVSPLAQQALSGSSFSSPGTWPPGAMSQPLPLQQQQQQQEAQLQQLQAQLELQQQIQQREQQQRFQQMPANAGRTATQPQVFADGLPYADSRAAAAWASSSPQASAYFAAAPPQDPSAAARSMQASAAQPRSQEVLPQPGVQGSTQEQPQMVAMPLQPQIPLMQQAQMPAMQQDQMPAMQQDQMPAMQQDPMRQALIAAMQRQADLSAMQQPPGPVVTPQQLQATGAPTAAGGESAATPSHVRKFLGFDWTPLHSAFFRRGISSSFFDMGVLDGSSQVVWIVVLPIVGIFGVILGLVFASRFGRGNVTSSEINCASQRFEYEPPGSARMRHLSRKLGSQQETRAFVDPTAVEVWRR